MKIKAIKWESEFIRKYYDEYLWLIYYIDFIFKKLKINYYFGYDTTLFMIYKGNIDLYKLDIIVDICINELKLTKFMNEIKEIKEFDDYNIMFSYKKDLSNFLKNTSSHFINLDELIRFYLNTGMKIFSYRYLGYVQELIKANSLKRDFADKFREDLKQKYIEIWDDTKG